MTTNFISTALAGVTQPHRFTADRREYLANDARGGGRSGRQDKQLPVLGRSLAARYGRVEEDDIGTGRREAVTDRKGRFHSDGAHLCPDATRANASVTPPSKTTELTTSAVESIVTTTVALSTASGAERAANGARLDKGAVADADRSHTVTASPADSSLCAIAEPMIPAPSTATAGWPRCGLASIIARAPFSSFGLSSA